VFLLRALKALGAKRYSSSHS